MNDEKASEIAASEEKAAGHLHGHIHEQINDHYHAHYHGQIHAHIENGETGKDAQGYDPVAAIDSRHGQAKPDMPEPAGKIITLRCHTGISGDMLLTALAALFFSEKNILPDSRVADELLGELAGCILPDLANCLVIRKHKVNGICGWQAHVNLPRSREFRGPEDVREIIAAAKMHERAAKRALACVDLLAACESQAHDIPLEQVHFHEVGALDSILDICAVCEIFVRLAEPCIVCSPLPMADGQISCAHGALPAPAPAVLQLLKGIPVRPFAGDQDAGELVTPTGLALLRALDVRFAPWPEFIVGHTALVYGEKRFAGVANGLVAALGK